MLRSFRSVFALCLLLVCAVVLASCGSDSSGDTSASGEETASGGQEGGSAPAGEPIKIGLISGVTGPFSSALGLTDDLADVWETSVNEEGGINGAPVELIVKDSQSDPSKATVAARELADEGVIAVAGLWDTAATAYVGYLEKEGIPVIGGEPVDPTQEPNPMFFPSGGSIPALQYGVLENVAKAGNSQLALVYCAEYAGCTALASALGQMAGIQGDVEIATEQAISATAPSYTAQCLEAEQSGADSAYIVQTMPILLDVLTDCEQQGFVVDQYNNGNDISKDLLPNAIAEGMVATYKNMPAKDTSTPGGEHMNEMIDQYAPEIKEAPEWNESLTLEWAGLQLFRKAAELAEISPTSTSDDLVAGLYQIKDETLEGIAPPLTFTKGKSKASHCWFTAEIKDEAVPPVSNEPACVPDAQAEEVASTLGA